MRQLDHVFFAFSKVENKFYEAKISKWWVISLSTSEESRVTMLVYEVVVMYMSCHDVHVLSTLFHLLYPVHDVHVLSTCFRNISTGRATVPDGRM